MTLMNCEFQPGPHARTRLNQRGISKMEALDVMNKGVKQIKKKKIIAKFRGVTIVYKKKPCHIFVITAY